jgi:hypothetical protein
MRGRGVMPQGLRRGLADIANARVHHGFRGDTDEIRTIIDSHDVVVAVWPDEYEAEGVGILLVKGEELLQAGLKELASIGQD